MLVHVDVEQQRVEQLRRGGHEVDDYPAKGPDKRGQYRQPGLVRTYQCTQDLRRVPHRCEW
jgi:hypothetical protein